MPKCIDSELNRDEETDSLLDLTLDEINLLGDDARQDGNVASVDGAGIEVRGNVEINTVVLCHRSNPGRRVEGLAIIDEGLAVTFVEGSVLLSLGIPEKEL